jgi:hypothetical protein
VCAGALSAALLCVKDASPTERLQRIGRSSLPFRAYRGLASEACSTDSPASERSVLEQTQMSRSSSLPIYCYSMYRLSRNSWLEELGMVSMAKRSSAANLKSSLGFIVDSCDAFRPSSTKVVTVSSTALTSFSISLTPNLMLSLPEPGSR